MDTFDVYYTLGRIVPITRTRETVAIEVLQNPERFGSLPRRTEFERVLCLWRLPSFEPHSSWSLFKSNGGKSFFVRRMEHDPSRGFPSNVEDPHIFASEAPFPVEMATTLICEFEGLAVPIFRHWPFAGVDGTSYGIRFGSYWQGTTVNWWSQQSAEWQPLMDIFSLTVSRFETHLPASTLREVAP